MGIKCSLLGHSYTETTVEEEREEQGSEVLTTIKEVETCERCGKERVVSENKEVTSLEAAEGEGDEEAGDDAQSTTTDSSADTPSQPTPTPDIDAAEDDAELIGEAEGDDETAADDEEPPEPTTAADDTTTEEVTAADDDAVILDDEDDEPEREPGEWPDDDEPNIQSEQDETTATAADTGEATETTGSETDTTTETDEPTGDATGEWPDEFGSDTEMANTAPEVEWPEEDQPAASEWEPSESLTSNIDSADIEPAGNATVTVPEGEFECPECGFRTSVEESSLRAGDFCPECRRGSLEHRADETRKE